MGFLGKLVGRHAPDGAAPAPVPPMADLPSARLQSPARYLGTFTDDDQKVTGHSLAAKSSARLNLSAEALDVVRMAGSFRIPADALRGATSAGEFGGQKVESLLVVRWEHDGQQWRTGFRMESSKNLKKGTSAPDLDQWVRTISKMARKTAGGK